MIHGMVTTHTKNRNQVGLLQSPKLDIVNPIARTEYRIEPWHTKR